jgi:hypothetical protein
LSRARQGAGAQILAQRAADGRDLDFDGTQIAADAGANGTAQSVGTFMAAAAHSNLDLRSIPAERPACTAPIKNRPRPSRSAGKRKKLGSDITGLAMTQAKSEARLRCHFMQLSPQKRSAPRGCPPERISIRSSTQ